MLNTYSDSIKDLVESLPQRPQALTLRETTEHQLTRAKAEVMRLEELLVLLDAHPETQRILELLGKGCY